MKIFFVNTALGWGGGEKWHLETALAMNKKGHDIAVLTQPHSELFLRSVSTGLITFPVRVSNLSFLNPFIIIQLRKLLKSEKPDILILNFSADLKTVGLAARLAMVKHIIYRRGNAKPIRDTLFNRFLYRKIIDNIIANSMETRNAILQNNERLVPVEKIKIIYNGINLSGFDLLPVVPYYNRVNSEFIIGSAGRLSPEKGHKHLIDMAAMLKSYSVVFKILLAGEGPLEQELKQAIFQKGVEDRFVFLGFVDNMKSFMENVDIFVLPSLWEGFGYVSIEAMACRKPVVCFATGSNPEIVKDNETGILVKPFDVSGLAAKVKMLSENRMLGETLGKAGRKRVEQYFELRSVEDELEQFLYRLCS
jgi:glycosyltransferase involved in cell wall biosynthesis